MWAPALVSAIDGLIAPNLRVRVFAVDGENAASDFAQLSDGERLRAMRFQRSADRASFVAGRAALRRELGGELGISPTAVVIGQTAWGRPRLPAGLADDLDFNVTHSGGHVAIAVARGRRVGVDIESVTMERDLELLIREVMGSREQARLARLDGLERTHTFYECWTRKEALVKAFGIGISYPLRAIDIPELPADGRVALDENGTSLATARHWTVRTARVSGSLVLSVAFDGE